MKPQRKWFWIIPLVLIVVVLGALVVYRDAAHMVFRNLTVPTYNLDATQDWSGGTSYLEIPYANVSSSDYLNLYVPDSEAAPPLFVLIHGECTDISGIMDLPALQ